MNQKELKKTDYPEINLPGYEHLLELYYKALELANKNIAHNDKMPSGYYMSEGFAQDKVWLWDSCFMAMFCRFAPDALPGIQSLDNFYAIQREDGYMPMAFLIENKKEAYPLPHGRINPPLASWAELEYYKISGNAERVMRIIKNLVRFDQWIEANRRRQDGTYWFSSCAASGMDNSPRTARRNNYGNDVGFIDLAAQQALSAKCIATLAEAVGEISLSKEFKTKYSARSNFVNNRMWCDKDGFFYDLLLEGLEHENYQGYFSACKSAASFWPLLAGITSHKQTDSLIKHLMDPREFNRPHPVPTLSADNPNYSETGGYWHGGVWAPTNYMVIKGLMQNNYHELAREIALKHLEAMYFVYKNLSPHTIWECYSPEKEEPALNEKMERVKSDFVGWSGLGPIAMLIETILGLDIDYPAGKITWRSGILKKHGIKNLRFGNYRISLLAKKRQKADEIPEIVIDSPVNIKLDFIPLQK